MSKIRQVSDTGATLVKSNFTKKTRDTFTQANATCVCECDLIFHSFTVRESHRPPYRIVSRIIRQKSFMRRARDTLVHNPRWLRRGLIRGYILTAACAQSCRGSGTGRRGRSCVMPPPSLRRRRQKGQNCRPTTIPPGDTGGLRKKRRYKDAHKLPRVYACRGQDLINIVPT